MAYLGIIIAIVGNTISLICVIISIFLCNRTESNEDRIDIVNLIVSIKDDVSAMRLEMKDFHGRLERHDAEFRNRLLIIQERRPQS